MDRRKFVLLEALKAGALHAGEMRLYERGKLPGLFAHRTRLNADIASAAVRDGLLEVVRTETLGKTTVEWVRVTAKGLDYLLQSESPARALDELRAILELNQQGIPTWLADMNARLDELSRRCAAEIEQVRLVLAGLAERAVAAIQRAEQPQAGPAIPWAHAALEVLEQRKQVGLGDRCPLADLFAALKTRQTDLSLREFHQGLKCLQDRGLLTLLRDLPNGDAPSPEYALLDGPAVYYYVTRAQQPLSASSFGRAG
jgi:DNA-binding transcriptional ArsR family regulator